MAFGKIYITIDRGNKTKTNVELTNVIYIPNFMANLVSCSILEDKEVYIDSENRRFHRRGQIVITFIRVDEHYLLKDNITKDSPIFALATSISVKLRTTRN